MEFDCPQPKCMSGCKLNNKISQVLSSALYPILYNMDFQPTLKCFIMRYKPLQHVYQITELVKLLYDSL